jgi:hypothetical protein
MKELLSLRIPILLTIFFVLFFLIRYMNHLYVFMPVRLYGSDEAMTLKDHVLYNFIPYGIYVLLKMFIVSGILYASVWAVQSLDQEDNTLFAGIFKVTVIAESVYLLEILFQVIYFVLIKSDYTFDDYHEFSLLSLHSIFNSNSFLLQGLFKSLSIFELLHVVFLAIGLRIIIDLSNRALLIMISIYGTVFILSQILWLTIWS